MSRYGFDALPAGSFAEAWRPLERALYRWVIGHQGSTLLARVAAWASLADGRGDTALWLSGDAEGGSEMPALTEAEIAALAAEPMVGSPDTDAATPVPFVLDADGRFYLWRNYRHEVAVADAVMRRRDQADAVTVAEDDIDTLFHGIDDDTVAQQRLAVRRVAGRKLFVLTGGPGTGKTTTVLRMLLMLQRRASRPLTIQVAAPTGKAAQRLVQSLREGKQKLRRYADKPLPADWHPLLENVPDQDALTLHRLLGYRPYDNVFARDAKDPIPADIVVVDEASMVDLAMLRGLLDAVRPDATLILVGDADQLTSVAAGSVLMDLVTAMDPAAGEGGDEERAGDATDTDDLVKLRHSFRAEQYLVDINQAINAGDAGALQLAMAAAAEHARHIAIDTPQELGRQIERWSKRIAKTDELRASSDGVTDASGKGPVEAALDALARRQLLCAMREGPYGATAVNQAIEHRLRKEWDEEPGREWYPGRAVIIVRNDYTAGLFNGDVGICLADADGHLRVWFEGSPESVAGDDAQPARRFRSFAPNALPPHKSAFAITIHKSQGSEYAHVAVLLPPDAESRILSRQLLYTGVSRAKRSVELWAGDAALATAVTHSVQRQGGVAAKLAQRNDAGRSP
jgi:exodeoxyribonuclease V alpha subunit